MSESRKASSKLSKKKAISYCLLLMVLFALWITPVFRSFNHRTSGVYSFKANKEVFVFIHSSWWEWQTNALSLTWSVITTTFTGGYSGPIQKSEGVLYKLTCSGPQLVLSTSGSVGEMLIYQSKMYFINVEFTDQETAAGYYDGLGTTKIYVSDKNKFSTVPTNSTMLQWRKKAEKVIRGEVLLGDHVVFDICGKEFAISESSNSVYWSNQGKQNSLFKPRPNRDRIGW